MNTSFDTCYKLHGAARLEAGKGRQRGVPLAAGRRYRLTQSFAAASGVEQVVVGFEDRDLSGLELVTGGSSNLGTHPLPKYSETAGNARVEDRKYTRGASLCSALSERRKTIS